MTYLQTNAFSQEGKLDNGYGYKLDFFTNQRHFILRHAFLPTATATMLAAWFYHSLSLFSFVLHSTLHYYVHDDLQYAHYSFSVSWVSALLAGSGTHTL